MKKVLTGVAVAFQLLVLGFMAGEREWVLRNGETVYLRTQPVDPQDPFRGDYVRLDYEANHVPTNVAAPNLMGKDDRFSRGRKVYAVLARDEDGFGKVTQLTGEQPAGGLFLKGRTGYFYSGNPVVGVDYGIEAYFVQQGKGRVIEAGRVRGEVRVPLDMEIAVGHGGVAVLKTHRWCALGIGLKLENTTNRQVRAATVTLVNVSSNTLAVVDPVSSGRLRLEPDSTRGWGPNAWEWVGKDRPILPPTEAMVVVLKPGEEKPVHVDLNQPEWFIRKPTVAAQSIGAVQDFAGFRFVYQAPDKAACAKLPNPGLIWHGELRTQVFTSGGRWD